MDTHNSLFRELNDSTATERWLEGMDFTVKRVLVSHEPRAGHWTMAVSFYHGAESLREVLLKEMGYDLFEREYAMLFLYRHSMELFLKHAIQGKAHGHNLESLLNQLIQQIKQDYNLDVSQGWFANEITELSKVDPTAQGFRYSHDVMGNPALPTSYFVDLEELGKRMSSLYSVFLHMSIARGDFASGEEST